MQPYLNLGRAQDLQREAAQDRLARQAQAAQRPRAARPRLNLLTLLQRLRLA